ncbi:MAG: hypothetical protein AB7I48_28550 [Planctomycetaceae bacterium]
MRLMQIPPFRRKVKITNLRYFLKTRLRQNRIMKPEQAIPLVGYMCYPNDRAKRKALQTELQIRLHETNAMPDGFPRRLLRIQHDWLRIADIFHLHRDLVEGRHQARRGGPSIGKAITLAAANTKSRGTGVASLWKKWSSYKDVAHIVTAATLICAEARTRFRQWSPGPTGLRLSQFGPLQMALLMPDLVLAVGLEFERTGLTAAPHASSKPTTDSKTLWRIPPDVNVVPIPPQTRKIRGQDLIVLNKRRAGNRGRANARKTTPVFR